MNGTATKAWVALACTAIVTVAVAVSSAMSDGNISHDEWWAILLSLLGTIATPISVYQAKNATRGTLPTLNLDAGSERL